MSLAQHQNGWAIIASFLVAMILTLMPLPDGAEWFRPEWVAMVLIYWCMALPERVNIGVAWIMGLFLDVARGALLGQYALALTLVAFLTIHLHRRVRNFPLWQQSLAVLVLVALEQLLVLWVKGIIGQSPNSWLYWAPSLTSMLLWPWMFLILRDLRRHFRVT
ncbi:rod shape-determining protein MreD [Thiohalomonas denitrificans]|uniref:Rod shape-determining protein MreD n=1 Tax=Thiohalomonas denitrificans TaxID=415747 RepID=A0A1G5Q864_9GAMM|nr:rod shape-determining protein MreD [Thiohalomonas denitrificans]SCZ58054.1 rod shape-determining protein MreD [Thiohalomonas denitrificans]